MKDDKSTLTRRELLGATALLGLGGPLKRFAQASPADSESVGPRERPNIIIFMPDELRADALGCYGNPVAKTPNIDYLASVGTRFENCHVQFPVCGASRCSMVTGWPTSVRGHRSLYDFLKPHEPNLFRYLLYAGYDVFMFGKNDVLAPETYAGSLTAWGASGTAGLQSPASTPTQNPTTMLLPASGDRRSLNDYSVIQAAVRILERRETERPFCIFLALFEPHPPYTIPADFYDLYRPTDIAPLAPPGLPHRPAFHAALRQASGLDRVTDAEFRKLRAVYYGQVTYADWLLGELIEAVQRTGHEQDTALFLCSDHGDYTGDYGLVEKWPSGLEDCLTHVPLIGRIPGGESGIVSRELVELFDIMPSCLELAGTKADHTHFARSLLPQLRGSSGDAERAAFTEGGYNVYEPQAFEEIIEGLYGPKTRLQNERPETISRCAAIRTQRYKYIARPNGQSELYDCVKDRLQTNNLIADGSMHAVLEQLQVRLMNWYINTSGVPVTGRDPRGSPTYIPPTHFEHPPDMRQILDH
jgi:choline-sulfatase